MTQLSSKRQAVIDAYNKGYRVINNNVQYNGKVRKLDIRHKKNNGIADYASFGVRDNNGKRVQIFVHHLAAYQKYKNKFIEAIHPTLKEELVVIHLDSNPLNNNPENIILGTRGEVAQKRLNGEYK